LKILICARGYNSFRDNTIGTFELDQAKALKAAGFDVRIASLDLRSVKRIRPIGAKLFRKNSMHCVTVNSFSSMLPGGLSEKRGTKAARTALKWICNDGWQPDIIHAHFTEIASCFAQAAGDTGAKFVVTEHSSLMNTDSPNEKNLAQAKKAYLAADKVVAVSSALARNIKTSTGIQPEVIGNVVDTDVFSSISNGSGQDTFKFVSCGNLVDVKNFELLFTAFSKLHNSNAQLTIFGDGVKKQQLVNLCKSLGIADKVRFKGHQPREVIAKEYAVSDAFVLASKSETFGVSFIEAMCAGLPVVATRCGGPEDFVSEHNGLLCENGDVDSLVRAMDTMMFTAISYDRRRIHNFAVHNYSPNGVAQKLTALYDSI
jgi:glycosyltransferase involved in cell wall biosynthesis